MSFVSKPIVIIPSAIGTVGGGAYLLKKYLSGKMYENDDKLTNKVFVVTGSNQGIGRAVVTELAKRDAKVVMACRDMKSCEEARKDIVTNTKNKYVYCRPCDLASQESIKQFVERFKKEHQRLDVLINNAGVMRCPKSHTKEGIEMHLGVNHMGHFLLTNLLLDVLKASAPSRIVNVTSIVYERGKIHHRDLNSENGYDAAAAYAQSKLANVLFTRELAKKLKDHKITVNAVHPGIVDTAINRHMSFYSKGFNYWVLRPFLWPFLKTPRNGAQQILFASLDSSLENVTGQLILNYQVKEPEEKIETDTWSKWLWLTSEKWTGVKYN